MSDSSNPYLAPQTTDLASPKQVAGADNEFEDIRRKHLNHEASIQGIGSLYLLGGTLMLLAMGALFASFRGAPGPYELVLLLFVGPVQVIAGWGMRTLRRFGQVLGTLTALVGLIGFPIGTLISLYVLFLLWSPKGQMVFSDRYREIRAATPHIKYRTPLWLWLILGILVAGLAGAILFAALSGA